LRRRSDSITAWLLVLPAIVIIGTFVFYPMAQAFYLSFFRWNLFGDPSYTGWDNYQALFNSEPFRYSLRNTALFTIGNLIGTYVLALGAALLVNNELRGIKFFRTVNVLPVVIPMVIAGLIWKWIYEPQYGLANTMLALFGQDGLNWLFDSSLALPSVLLVTIWKDFGIYMLVLLAGLQGIPRDLIEAAVLDRASWWQQLRHVILPQLRPASFFVVILVMFNSFKIFDQVWVMTEGGPGNATLTVVSFIYSRLFTNVGIAAAASVLLFVLLVAVTIPQLRWSGSAND
jgi:ABC-type sugar transport system permease subunit